MHASMSLRTQFLSKFFFQFLYIYVYIYIYIFFFGSGFQINIVLMVDSSECDVVLITSSQVIKEKSYPQQCA